MKYIFGPVSSRRLGISLGIDIVPYKTCTFNCIYCECGSTTVQTTERKPYIKIEPVIDEFKKILPDLSRIDYVTITGSGEPTLNTNIRKIIDQIKKLTAVPVAVLTNGSLFHLKAVRKALLKADLVVPSLDSCLPNSFKRIDQPLPQYSLEDYINGLVSFRKEYKGQLWLETFFIKGLNDSDKDINFLIKSIKRIKPEKIQLNTIDRPPIEKTTFPVSQKKLQEICTQFIKNNLSAEIIHQKRASAKKTACLEKNIKNEIFNLLKRRPETLDNIAKAFGISINKIKPVIISMVREKAVTPVKNKKSADTFYKITQTDH